jgi:hypothetical protein
MSILKKVSDFLFGKDPDIFDDKGQVLHKLPKRKWDDWHNRIVKGEEYNWRTHAGTKSGAEQSKNKEPKH